MSRLPFVPRAALDETGAALWDAVVERRPNAVVGAGEGLDGPYNVWVTAPAIGTKLSDLVTVFRTDTTIDRRLLELATITVGAHFHAEFEWWAHSRYAREHGIDDAVVDAIARGDDPPFTKLDERAIHSVTVQLAEQGRIDDATYAAAQALLGDRGMVELVSLVGYYTLVCFTLNAFEVALPDGVARTWPD